MGRVIYTDTEKVRQSLEGIKETLKHAIKISEYIEGWNIDITEGEFVDFTNNQYWSIIQRYKKLETNKIQAVIKQFGDTALTDGWEVKVENKVRIFGLQIRSQAPHMPSELKEYVKCIKFDQVPIIDPKYDEKYFKDKYSVKVGESKEEFYKNHTETCRLLNELIKGDVNEYEEFDKLFHYSESDKKFYPTIDHYL